MKFEYSQFMALPMITITSDNGEEIGDIILKITVNHWRPDKLCPLCEGEVKQTGIIIGKFLIDGVQCQNCKTLGNKCAAYKGENCCVCQDK